MYEHIFYITIFVI